MSESESSGTGGDRTVSEGRVDHAVAPQPPLSTRPDSVYFSLSLSIYRSGLWSFFLHSPFSSVLLLSFISYTVSVTLSLSLFLFRLSQ